MAVNLPNSNLDFVPLDVLTAAEMNKLVANDKYLADLWGGTSGNGIVKPKNLGGFSGSTDSNGWMKFITADGKTGYRKAGSAGQIKLGAGISYGDYFVPGPSGVTLSADNCVVKGSFTSQSDRALICHLYSINSDGLHVGALWLYTGNGITFIPRYSVEIIML